MINASLKNRINISHRRMKTSIQAFNNVTSKKNNPKQQKLNEILQKGKTFYNNENFNLAIPQFQDYLQYRQNDDEALYLCAISFLHLDQPLQAIKRLEKISPSYVNKQQSYLLIAMSFSKLESYQKSLQVINQCLQKYQRFEEGYSFRGKLYLKFQQFEMAQKDFFYSLKLNPQSFISRAALGDCYFQQHKYQSALQSYTQCLKYISHPKYLSNISDIQLKKGICYFSLQLYPQTIHQLQQLTNKQANCQSYFYLGVSYLKIGKKQEGILNLEYCIKLQAKDNKSLIEKAFKCLIQLYLGDYQFYQAVNVLKLIEPLDGVVDCGHWKEFVEGCMLVIKAYYQDGLDKLNRIYKIIKQKEDKSIPSNKLVKKSQHQSLKKSHRYTIQDQYQNQFLTSSQKPKPAKDELKKLHSRGRKSFSLKHVRKQSFNEQTRNKTIFKSTQNKAFTNNNPYKTNDIRLKHFFTRSIKAKKPHQKHQHKDFKPIFTQEQVIFIMPILLRFKAYAQFFNNNYLRSLDTYEEYENYIKSIFGKEIGELGYNRAICEGFLMNKTELYRQSIEKMSDAIEIYQKFYNNVIPVEPLLYKIATYLKLSLQAVFQNSSQVQDCDLLFDQVLDVVTRYKHELDNHHLTHYYLGIMAFFCGQYTQAQTQLQRTLKIVEQCSWKYLWLKGLIEINLSNFYEAIKQFTAGLILQQAPSLYLSRAISFLLQGTRRKQRQSKGSKRKKLSLKSNLKLQTSNVSDSKNEEVSSEVFIQNSFQDLQKFIELQTDQQKISLWVTKLLFFNEAYEEAARALEKVDNKCEQLLQLEFWIRFYEGDFQECGKIGNLMMDAFQGKILNQDQENHESLMNLSQNGNIIDETLKFSKVPISYQKWIIILHLFKRQKYSTLIKYLQKQVFDTESFQQEVQLKYNIGITYFMQGQINKALNFFQSFLSDVSGHEKLQLKIRKILNMQFTEDECVPDLSDQISINSNHRLSQYLPYKSVQLNHKHLRRIFIKPSIPFPQFPKPSIIIKASQQFFQGQLDLQRVNKRIQAPWIKRNKQKVQFTEQIVEAYTDFLKETKQMSIPNDEEDLIQQDDEIDQTTQD